MEKARMQIRPNAPNLPDLEKTKCAPWQPVNGARTLTAYLPAPHPPHHPKCMPQVITPLEKARMQLNPNAPKIPDLEKMKRSTKIRAMAGLVHMAEFIAKA